MRTQAIGNGTLRARIPAQFAAVMLALKLHGADTTMLRSLSDEEWRELLPLMDRAHLTLPFAQRHVSGIPDWVRKQLGNNLADTAAHWEHCPRCLSRSCSDAGCQWPGVFSFERIYAGARLCAAAGVAMAGRHRFLRTARTHLGRRGCAPANWVRPMLHRRKLSAL